MIVLFNLIKYKEKGCSESPGPPVLAWPVPLTGDALHRGRSYAVYS